MYFNNDELNVLDNMDLTGVRNPLLIQLQLRRQLAKVRQEEADQARQLRIEKREEVMKRILEKHRLERM